MDPPEKKPLSTRAFSVAALSVIVGYLVYCGLFMALVNIQQAPPTATPAQIVTVASYGLIVGGPIFAGQSAIAGHGLAFLVIGAFIASMELRMTGRRTRTTLIKLLVLGAIGGALTGFSYEASMMVMENQGVPTGPNLVMGVVGGLMAAWVLWRWTPPKVPDPT